MRTMTIECFKILHKLSQTFPDNLAVIENYTFNVSNSYMKILSLDNEGIEMLSAQKESNSHPQVVVTAVSANHADSHYQE
jgi:hypothetical protein